MSNRNKFRAVKTVVGGVKYDSKFEAKYGSNYDLMLKRGELINLERQFPIPLVVNGVKVCNYIIDYVLTYPDKSIEYIEIKGMATSTWRVKFKLFRALYPEYKVSVIYKDKTETFPKPLKKKK